jgi:hypothetical protein
MRGNSNDMTTLDDGKADADDEEQWLFFELDEAEQEEYTALRGDIPEWLETSLWEWIKDAFTVRPHNVNPIRQSPSTAHFDNDLVRECERVLRVPILWNVERGSDLRQALSSVRLAYQGHPARDLWRLVNYLLLKGHAHGGVLKTYLLDAGSTWTVADRKGKCKLERRVPDGVEVAATATFHHANGGKRLATAWGSAFGVNPDPSKAYWFAVKAVEDASVPVAIPNDPSPTLGKVISRIEQGGQFKLPHLREDPNATSHDVLLRMLKQLWFGQYDRHGGLPQSPLPDDVTQEEAETAVMTAVSLVGLFATGKVQP